MGILHTHTESPRRYFLFLPFFSLSLFLSSLSSAVDAALLPEILFLYLYWGLITLLSEVVIQWAAAAARPSRRGRGTRKYTRNESDGFISFENLNEGTEGFVNNAMMFARTKQKCYKSQLPQVKGRFQNWFSCRLVRHWSKIVVITAFSLKKSWKLFIN